MNKDYMVDYPTEDKVNRLYGTMERVVIEFGEMMEELENLDGGSIDYILSETELMANLIIQDLRALGGGNNIWAEQEV